MILAGAIDIGGTNTRVALVSKDGEIIKRRQFVTPIFGKSEDIACKGITVLQDLTGDDFSCLTGIGVAAAGPLDPKSGALIKPPNIPFDQVPITKPIKDYTELEVFLLNDCQAAVLGEIIAGGGRGYKNIVYITISTGIGGGVFTNGKVLIGRGGNAAEIGHFPVDTTYNITCSCGYRGHWEGYASGKTIYKFFDEWCSYNKIKKMPGLRTSRDILESASSGDNLAKCFCEDLAKINGRGLSAVIAAYDPECVIYDGAVVRNHPWLIEDMIEKTDRYLELPIIRLTQLDGNAPLIGAAMGVFYKDMIMKI